MLKCFIVPTMPFYFIFVQYSRLVRLFGPLEAFKFEHLARRYSTNSEHPDTSPAVQFLPSYYSNDIIIEGHRVMCCSDATHHQFTKLDLLIF